MCKIPATGGPSNVGWILYPGLYPGGLEVSPDRTVYLMPGIYWIGGGGIDIGGGGSIVTIATEADARPNVADAPCAAAVTSGEVVRRGADLQLEASEFGGGNVILNSNAATMKLASFDVPTTDPNSIYKDIVFFQDRTVLEPVTSTVLRRPPMVEGIIYAPGAEVKLNGNGGTLLVDQVIANTFKITGSTGTIKVLRGKGVDAVITAAGLVD